MTAEEDIVMEATAEPDAATKTPATAAISKALASSWAFETAMLPLSMVLVQVFTMVTLLICKLAVNAGMRPVIFLVYRNLIAAAAITQLALVFEREMWKKLTLAIWGWIFVNAALGNVKKESCFFPIPQAVECILRILEKANAPVIYLSTDAAESETNLLQSLVVFNDRQVPLVKRPEHHNSEKWDALLYRNHMGGDN